MTHGNPGPLFENICLRDAEAGDLPLLFEHQLDVEANRMAATYPRDAKAFDEHWAKILGDRSTVAKVIVAQGLVVGYVTCFQMDGQHAVGYWIAREYWGKGIATRALALLLDEVSIRPLHARVARDNVASIRVLERCGFAITGYQLSPATDRFPECEEVLLRLD